MAERLGHLQPVGDISIHFWLYSTLAAPFVRLAETVRLNPLAGFTAVNVALLAAAFAILLPRAGGAATLLLMVSPILWWVDKAHTEPFTFSLLTAGVVWLFPVAVPLFVRARPVLRGRAARALWVAAAASAAWSRVCFHPRAPEDYRRPTALARCLWTHYPSVNDPLPEVFSERLLGTDGWGWAPVGTPGCEKILLVGRGRHDGLWPLPCQPLPVPAVCDVPGSVCYANRSGVGYDFVAVPLSNPALWFRYRRQATWPLSTERVAAHVLGRLRAWERTEPADMIRGESVERLAGVQGAGRLVAYLDGILPDAAVIVRAPTEMRAVFVNAETGDVATSAVVPPGAQRLAVPQVRCLILTLESARRPAG